MSISPYRLSWNDISAAVDRARFAIQHNQDEALRCLGELRRELVDPVSGSLQKGDRIIFVPTRSLFRVPFAALFDRETGHFLIQDHAVGIATSAAQFIASVERDRGISATPLSSALLVGNPLLGEQRESWFGKLPGAEREIEGLSRTYHDIDVQVLTGGDATPARVLAELARAEIFHLAAHSVDDPVDPAQSHLVLSPGEGNQGSLFLGDILKLRLPHTRLVVLAACETQVGPVSASEGPLSLSASFLAAGVPAVVGSLWQVKDDGTMRLSLRFHQELKKGSDALAALRSAQLEELKSQRDRFDWNWASFQVFGGVDARVPRESVPNT